MKHEWQLQRMRPFMRAVLHLEYARLWWLNTRGLLSMARSSNWLPPRKISRTRWVNFELNQALVSIVTMKYLGWISEEFNWSQESGILAKARSWWACSFGGSGSYSEEQRASQVAVGDDALCAKEIKQWNLHTSVSTVTVIYWGHSLTEKLWRDRIFQRAYCKNNSQLD